MDYEGMLNDLRLMKIRLKERWMERAKAYNFYPMPNWTETAFDMQISDFIEDIKQILASEEAYQRGSRS